MTPEVKYFCVCQVLGLVLLPLRTGGSKIVPSVMWAHFFGQMTQFSLPQVPETTVVRFIPFEKGRKKEKKSKCTVAYSDKNYLTEIDFPGIHELSTVMMLYAVSCLCTKMQIAF